MYLMSFGVCSVSGRNFLEAGMDQKQLSDKAGDRGSQSHQNETKILTGTVEPNSISTPETNSGTLIPNVDSSELSYLMNTCFPTGNDVITLQQDRGGAGFRRHVPNNATTASYVANRLNICQTSSTPFPSSLSPKIWGAVLNGGCYTTLSRFIKTALYYH